MKETEMSKKTFSGGLNSLLESTKASITAKEESSPLVIPPNVESKKRGRPKTATKEIEKTSQIGTFEGETRATFIVKEESLEKIKAIAYWDRLQIKDVLNEAIEAYFENKGIKYIQQALSAYENRKYRD